MLIEKWDVKIVDIDNAILNRELDHEIYMVIPEGYGECIEQCKEDEALMLEKAMYGLVQAARQFFKKVHDALIQANFKASEADPCLLYKNDQERGVCIILIYIDDMLIVGKTQAVKDAIQVLQQSFEVKKSMTLEDYLGVQVIKSKDGETSCNSALQLNGVQIKRECFEHF